MKNLAKTLVEVYYDLNFVEEDYAELDWSLKQCEEIQHAMEESFSIEEQEMVKLAAKNYLARLTRDPDEHGYTPRSLVSDEQRQFLTQISLGNFCGYPSE